MNFAFRQKGNTYQKSKLGITWNTLMKSDDPIFVESLKALRSKVEYRIDMQGLRTLAVTSAIAGEGKTVVSAGLATNLASTGRKKVLLIDADLRKADVGKCFGIEESPGLAEFLFGTVGLKEILRDPVLPGLWVITGGKRILSSADTLSGEKFRSFLKEVRNRFDLILLDTPPLLPVADTMSLRDQVDGFIFLYRTGFTPYSMLQQAIEEIGEKNVVGVVLNGVDSKSPTYYKKYYGSYYHSGPQETAKK
jgi:tyrosine-protein kinase Etk/Wzc